MGRLDRLGRKVHETTCATTANGGDISPHGFFYRKLTQVNLRPRYKPENDDLRRRAHRTAILRAQNRIVHYFCVKSLLTMQCEGLQKHVGKALEFTRKRESDSERKSCAP